MRIAKWDNVKFVLIYFVVLGHFIQCFQSDSTFLHGLQFFIYTFHMPAFLFISGLFSKRTVNERRYDKILPYFFLYIFMKIFRFIVNYFLYGKVGGFNFLSENGVPWFALTLFWCYLFTIVLSRFNHIYLIVVAVFIGIMAGFDSNMGAFLSGMRTLVLYPFFLAGYCIPVQKVTDITNKKIVKGFSVLILGAVLVCSFVLENRLYDKLGFLKCKAGYAALGMLSRGGIYRALYYIIALILVFCVIALVPSVNCIFTRWGSRTLQVFALHFPVIRVLKDGLNLKENMSIWLPDYYGYFVPILAFILTIVLSIKIIEPFFSWLMHPKLIKKDE